MWILCAFILSFAAQEQAAPLPDAANFRTAVPAIVNAMNGSFRWALFHHDFIPNANEYNYTEKEVSVTQDAAAASETRVYTITRGPEIWQAYRRQLSRNGNPLTAQETEQQDRTHERFENNVRAALAKNELQSPSEKKATAEKLRQEGEAIRNELMAMFEVRVLGRERIESLPVVLLEVKPKRGYKPKTEFGDIVQNISMRVWVTEKDREVVRLTAAIDEKFDEGSVVLEKGADLSVERRPINGEVWLPTRIEINNLRTRTNGRLGPRQRVTTEFSDFRKFTVDTVIQPAGPIQ